MRRVLVSPERGAVVVAIGVVVGTAAVAAVAAVVTAAAVRTVTEVLDRRVVPAGGAS